MTGTSVESLEEPAPGDRPVSWVKSSGLWGWAGPLLVTIFAGFLRFDRLASPKAIVFDETFYAKDAYSLLRFGFERSMRTEPKDIADQLFLNGSPDQIWSTGGAFVAHPPVGKWMIALGEQIFGVNTFGWRFMAAVCGTLSVLILCRVARRMTGSTLLGCAAGFLMALDGLHLVLSRTALLDIFLMFWLLAGFACLVNDRDRARLFLAAERHDDPDRAIGPRRHRFRSWRLAAGVCFGLAAGVKWSAIPLILAFIGMVFLWDAGARRKRELKSAPMATFTADGISAILGLVVVPIIVYILSWSGWLLTTGGRERGNASSHVAWRMIEGLPKLWAYHQRIWEFHTGLTIKHDYQSWPWDWPALRRPVAFYWDDKTSQPCGGLNCTREILGIGTPAIWWVAIPCLLVMIFLYLVHRDWRAGAILLAYAAGWLSWLPSAFADRTMFAFYALPLLPFMCLAITMSLGLIIGPAQIGYRRPAGAVIAGAYVLLVLANFWYLYPILTAKSIPYDVWHAHMWMGSWI